MIEGWSLGGDFVNGAGSNGKSGFNIFRVDY